MSAVDGIGSHTNTIHDRVGHGRLLQRACGGEESAACGFAHAFHPRRNAAGAGRNSAKRVTAVALGGSHYCVLKSNRTVECAGRDLDGELGDGKLTNRTELAPVPGLSNVVQLAASSFKTCAIIEPNPGERQVLCFGADEGRGSGGTPKANAIPTRVGDGTRAAAPIPREVLAAVR